MKLGHVHIQFKDLQSAVRWMKEVAGLAPAYQNPRMAVFAWENSSLIFDQSEEDSAVTIAFDSDDCRRDFSMFESRGAETVEAPADQPWGVRAAYLKGPGATTIEIEQALRL